MTSEKFSLTDEEFHGGKVPEVQEEIWVAADGRQIPVGEMTPDHLRATLRMILKAARERRVKRRAFLRTIRLAELTEHTDGGVHW